jgi:hypothetical protein
MEGVDYESALVTDLQALAGVGVVPAIIASKAYRRVVIERARGMSRAAEAATRAGRAAGLCALLIVADVVFGVLFVLGVVR